MAEVDFTSNGGSDAHFGDSQEGYDGMMMEGAGHAGGDANPGDKINASKNDDDERYWHGERHFEFLGKSQTKTLQEPK